MLQPRQGLRFPQELFAFLLAHANVQDFDGSRLVEIDMLAQVDVGKAAPS